MKFHPDDEQFLNHLDLCEHRSGFTRRADSSWRYSHRCLLTGIDFYTTAIDSDAGRSAVD